MGCTNSKLNIQDQALASYNFQSSKLIKNFLTSFSKLTVHEQKRTLSTKCFQVIWLSQCKRFLTKNVCIPCQPFALSVLLSVDTDICRQLFLVIVSCYSKMSVDNFKMSVALLLVAPNFASWYKICELSVVFVSWWQLRTHN